MSAAVGAVEDLVAGDLRIDVVEDKELVRCDWSGRSVEREADLTLRPFFDRLLARAQEQGATLEMHFEALDYFNSSTIGTLITFIQKARRQKVHLRMVYAGDIKWQSLSFDALRMFEKGDQLFELRVASP
jgi:hypothetical protein